MKYDVLIIIDVQTELIEAEPYNKCRFLDNITKLAATARHANLPVIYVRHNGEEGDMLVPGTPGWEIYSDIAPKSDELVFDKHYNSAFKDTGLKDYLDKNSFNNVILCGMQTEYCVDTTCKVAFELGFNITIPHNGTTTFDNDIMDGHDVVDFYEQMIWQYNFAKVISVDQIVSEISEN